MLFRLNSLLPVLILLSLPLFCPAAEQSELHKQGTEFYAQKKYAEAIAALEKAVETEDPHSPAYAESTLCIGQSYFSLQQPAKAIPWLEKTTRDVDVSYLLGLAYLETHDVDNAEIAFARLFGVPAKSASAHLLTAELLLKREYGKEALPLAQKALALDPKLPGAHYLLGQIALSKGSYAEAVTEMSQELELNPNFSMAWYRLGDILARQEKWPQAIANLERAIWLNADFSGSYIVLGRCYFKTGNYGNAEGILRHALTLDPNNSTATNLLGQTLVAENKLEEGRALLEKSKTPQPK